MSLGFWSYDWEYWNLYHKVTFDGPNKLILVNEGITELDWKSEVYSSWKEWLLLENHLENPGYLQAMRVVGGDNINSDGTRKVGSTFFLMNGWRLRTWQGNHRLRIDGNVYTEEGEPIYVPTEGNYSITIEQNLSQLVEIVTTETVSGLTPPTPEEIANAVWNKIATDHISTGTFGLQLNMIKASSDVQTNRIIDITEDVSTLEDLIRTLLKYEKNRTRVDQVQRKLYVYDDDGTTVLRAFDLKDFTGSPSVTQIAERVPVP